MERRGFIGGLVAGIAALVMGTPKKQYTYGGGSVTGYTNLPNRVTAHYFDWSMDSPGDCFPFTTDPQYVGKLDYGEQNVVTVDGKEFVYVCRFMTGPNGFVEEQVQEDCIGQNGKPYKRPLIVMYDRWNGRYLTKEESDKLKWQCYTSDVTSPHYGKRRYDQRALKIIHRGLVEFRIDESRRWRHANQTDRGGANDQRDGKVEGKDSANDG